MPQPPVQEPFFWYPITTAALDQPPKEPGGPFLFRLPLFLFTPYKVLRLRFAYGQPRDKLQESSRVVVDSFSTSKTGFEIASRFLRASNEVKPTS